VVPDDALNVHQVFLVQFKFFVHLQVSQDFLGSVAVVNLDNQHFLGRYLNVDLVSQISFIDEVFSVPRIRVVFALGCGLLQ